MAFDPPDGILDIGNATLRVGKLEVAETSGLNQGLQNIVKNDLLVTENTEYTTNHKWGLKLPTTWVAEFEVKGHSGKYIDFNFYNENSASNALGYNLTFMDTTMTLRYDGGSALGGGAATIPTIVGAYRKVNIFFERGVISVSIDGTRYLYHKESDGFNQGLGVASRVVSATGSAFVNLFIEQNAADSAFKNLRIVNGRFISDKTSNIAFIGGNLGVGVNSPKEALDIRGNMHFNRVSNVSSISVDSNVVTEYTGPHDRPLREYPEVALTGATTGGYTASQSSEYDTSGSYNAWKAFDSSEAPNGTLAITQSSQYNNTSGTLVYTGDKNLLGDSNYKGEWIKLELPVPIAVEKMHLQPRNTFFDQTPNNFKIVGSNDDSSWDVLYHNNTAANSTISSDTEQVHHMTHNLTKYYKYVAIVVNTTGTPQSGNYVTMSVANIEYYGHEEGSASLDTTLKSVYNVPATTGTQLEVYYDAKDLADGAVSTPVLGLGGTTINATVYGDPQVSGGAFVFDGTGDYIKTSALPSTFVDDAQHSFSTWFKLDTTTGSQTLFTIGNADGDNQLPHVVVQDGTLRYDFYNNSRTLLDLSLVPNQWYHLAITFSGGNHNSGTKFYINGMYDANVNSGGNNPNATLDIQASSPLTIGGRHNGTQLVAGSIANFRLYSKALNAGQVQELYDYQKDYFLGSKSQVTLYKGHLGVGVTEPSGQLELAGDERIQEYPPGPLCNYETLIPGHGVFCAYATDTQGTTGATGYGSTKAAWYAFMDGNTATGNLDEWNTSYDRDDGTSGTIYDIGSGDSANSYNTARRNRRLGDVFGEWIVLKSPYPIKVQSIDITADHTWPAESPRRYTVLGSNDGNTWEILRHVQSGDGNGTTLAASTSPAAGLVQNGLVNSTKYYTHTGIVVTQIANYQHYFRVPRMRLFGTPGPTTLDKGSLTLGRSLDVPRVSRYDVDTETPRPEKLVVDFDTTVNSSPIDISGNGKGNHGTFYNGASYSSADKAFSFDGTNDYIQATTNLPAGDNSLSFSMWIKIRSRHATHRDTLFFLGGTGTNKGIGIDVYPDGNVYWYDRAGYHLLWNTSATAPANVGTNELFPLHQWVHVAATHVPGSNAGYEQRNKVYINGVKLADPASGTAYVSDGVGTLSIDANPTVSLGVYPTPDLNSCPDALISNFKLYNVVLEPSEVKKLYNLGRTGRSMVISDTAVGIGKAPEAQLDVRGAARFVHAEATDTLACNSLAYGLRGNLTTPRDHTCLAQRQAVRGNPCVITFKVNYVSSWVPGILTLTGTSVNTNSSAFQGDHVVVAYRRYSPGDSGTGDIDITVLNGSGSVSTNTGGTGKFNIVYTGTNTSGTQETIEITYSGGGIRDVFVAECVEYSRLYY